MIGTQIATVDMQRNMAMVMPWLQSLQPLLVVGPEGCGKSMLLRNCFDRMKNVSVATVRSPLPPRDGHVFTSLSFAWWIGALLGANQRQACEAASGTGMRRLHHQHGPRVPTEGGRTPHPLLEGIAACIEVWRGGSQICVGVCEGGRG